MRPIKVLCVDDHAAIREYIQTLLELEDDIELVGEAVSGWEAVEKASDLLPDVILMDINLPALSGIDAARLIREQHPSIGLVFIAAEDIWRSQALEVGGSVYLTKDIPPDELIRAIRETAERELAASPTETAERELAVSPTETAEPPRTLQGIWVRLTRRAKLVVALCILAAMGGAWALYSLSRSFANYAWATVALIFGFFFFTYATKYFASAALMLAFNGANGLMNNNNGNHNGNTFGNGTGRLRLFGRFNNHGNNNLNGNGDDYKNLALDYEPFVSIHLPMYNEANVVDRLLTVCTSFDYENYEVIVADDSTDETVEHLKEWAKHPRVKVSHRENRSGFKGAALQKAVEEYMNPRAEFFMVFDADFVPPPEIIWQCLGYFYGVDGNNNHNHGNGNNWTANNSNHDNNNNGSVKNKYVDDRVAVVQGYQWHMLNAGENWIAKGVRAEFSGSYVVERPGQEFFGSMKMISGSVYMMRTDVLRKLGWGTSITEDWEMTLKLYLDGYKVLYTPYIAAPAECISDFRRLSRQRMRWAEGHTYNVKKYFRRILACPHISWAEKLEFLYYTPYYLQAFFFCIGTVCWLISEVLLRQRLPYWTALWGWCLVFSNSLALVLMNLSGLFLENAVKKDIGGVLSALVLSNLLVPFQAYAALKGLLEKEEGGWFRTPKTGRITEVLDKFWLKKKLKQLLPRRKKRARKEGAQSVASPTRRRRPRLAPVAISLMLALTLSLWGAAGNVQAAANNDSTFWFYNQTSPMTYMMYQSQPSGTSQDNKSDVTFYSDTFDVTQQIYAGTASVSIYATNKSGASKNVNVTLYVYRGGSRVATLGSGTLTVPDKVSTPTLYSTSFSHSAFDFQTGDRLELECDGGGSVRVYWDGPYNDSRMEVGTIVPEAALALLPVGLAIPWVIKRVRKGRPQIQRGNH